MRIIDIKPEHISIYELTPEISTPLYGLIKKGVLSMPDENLISKIYYLSKEMLQKCGYLHYEISNFSMPGFECRHNINYWEGGEYIGIGAGAHSYFNGVRYSSERDVEKYIFAISNGLNTIVEHHKLTQEDRLKELIFLGLRKIKGFNMDMIPNSTLLKMKPIIRELIDYNLLRIKDNYLCLTDDGLILSNEVMVRLISVI